MIEVIAQAKEATDLAKMASDVHPLVMIIGAGGLSSVLTVLVNWYRAKRESDQKLLVTGQDETKLVLTGLNEISSSWKVKAEDAEKRAKVLTDEIAALKLAHEEELKEIREERNKAEDAQRGERVRTHEADLEVMTLRAEVEERDRKIKSLEEEIAELKEEFDDLPGKNRRMRRHIRMLEDILAQYGVEISDVDDELGDSLNESQLPTMFNPDLEIDRLTRTPFPPRPDHRSGPIILNLPELEEPTLEFDDGNSDEDET